MQNLGNTVARALEQATMVGVGRRSTLSLLFSGGLDSSILAWILKSRGLAVELVSIALAGGADATTAEESSRIMRLECRIHALVTNDILEVARELRRESPSLSLNDVAIHTAMRLAIDRASHPVVMSAQGADAVFLGYAHTKELAGPGLAQRAEEDLRKVLERDGPLARTFAASKGKELLTPFLDATFLAALSGTPWETRIRPDENKWLLRQAAREMGLPEEIVNRPKRGFQYGSGIYTELKRRL